MPTSRTKAKRSVRVNFKDAPRGGRVPEGEYNLRVVEVESFRSKSSNEPTLKWTFEVLSKDRKVAGKTLYYNTSLQPQALWRLRDTLEALDQEVPDGVLDLEFGELVGLECLGTVVDEEYEGQTRSRIQDLSPKTNGTRRAARDDDEDEEDEKPRRGRRAKDEDDEEEEEDAAPARRGKAKKPKQDELTAADVEDMDEEALDALIEEHELEIPRTARTRAKKAKAAVEALIDAGIIED